MIQYAAADVVETKVMTRSTGCPAFAGHDSCAAYFCCCGRKLGPTERIGLFSDEVVAVPVSAGGVAAGAPAVVAAGAAPFLAFAGVPLLSCRCCIFLALSSVTMMSPCCSADALSSADLSASAQVWPAALQEQDGLNSLRNLNAVGSAVYGWPLVETAEFMSSPGLRWV